MLVYLASYPRSGNTWTRELLEHYFQHPTGSIYVAKTRVELTERYGAGLVIPQHPAGFLTRELRQRMAEDDRVLLLKTHALPFGEYFAGEKVIHIVRHPGAALWSYQHYLRDERLQAVELDGLLRGYYGFGSWSQHTEQWLGVATALGPDYFRFTYEGLHEGEEGYCTGVARLTGLPICQPLGSFPPFEHWHALRPTLARSGKRDEWQANFTERQHRLLLELHGPTMGKLGYAVEMPPPPYAAETAATLLHRVAPDQLVRLLLVRLLPRVMHTLDRGVRITRRGGWALAEAVGRVLPRNPAEPLVIHATHLKAGSQWVAGVLKYSAAPGRAVRPQADLSHFTQANLRPGALLSTIYRARPEVEAVLAGYQAPVRLFFVMRDLRDTLVSLYFSLRYSHRLMGDVGRVRAILSEMTLEEGLLYLVAGEGMSNVARIARVQQSWLNPPGGGSPRPKLQDDAPAGRGWLLVRYEDLVADELRVFRQIVDYCQIQVAPRRLARVVAGDSFTARTQRQPGQEDIMAHQRKGIVGDWRNYFTDAVRAEFKARYGQHLIDTGYEPDLDW